MEDVIEQLQVLSKATWQSITGIVIPYVCTIFMITSHKDTSKVVSKVQPAKVGKISVIV